MDGSVPRTLGLWTLRYLTSVFEMCEKLRLSISYANIFTQRTCKAFRHIVTNFRCLDEKNVRLEYNTLYCYSLQTFRTHITFEEYYKQCISQKKSDFKLF